jgi:hypothetical protein
MKVLMVAAILGTIAAVGAAEARGYPYCLKTSPGPGDCKYKTYRQCEAARSGQFGTCVRNYGPR